MPRATPGLLILAPDSGDRWATGSSPRLPRLPRPRAPHLSPKPHSRGSGSQRFIQGAPHDVLSQDHHASPTSGSAPAGSCVVACERAPAQELSGREGDGSGRASSTPGAPPGPAHSPGSRAPSLAPAPWSPLGPGVAATAILPCFRLGPLHPAKQRHVTLASPWACSALPPPRSHPRSALVVRPKVATAQGCSGAQQPHGLWAKTKGSSTGLKDLRARNKVMSTKAGFPVVLAGCVRTGRRNYNFQDPKVNPRPKFPST